MPVAPTIPASASGKAARPSGSPTPGAATPAPAAKASPGATAATQRAAAKPAPAQPARVIDPGAPSDTNDGPEPRAGQHEPDFDKLITEHSRESAAARAEARRAKYTADPTAAQVGPEVELEAEPSPGAGEEPAEPPATELEEPAAEAEATADGEPSPAAEGDAKPEDTLTLDEAREALRLAREDPRQFAAKFAPALFSKQFESLAKRDAEARRREQMVKQAEGDVVAARNIVAAVRDPSRFGDLVKLAGPDFYDKLTRYMLNGGAPAAADLAAQRDQRLEALEAARADDAKAAEDRATVSEWRGELRGLLRGDRYKPVAALENAPAKVEALAAETLRQTGKWLTPSEAADILLEELTPAAPDDDTIERLLSDPTVRTKLEAKLGKTPAARPGATPRVSANAGDAQSLGNDTTVTKRQRELRRSDEEAEFERLLATEQR